MHGHKFHRSRVAEHRKVVSLSSAVVVFVVVRRRFRRSFVRLFVRSFVRSLFVRLFVVQSPSPTDRRSTVQLIVVCGHSPSLTVTHSPTTHPHPHPHPHPRPHYSTNTITVLYTVFQPLHSTNYPFSSTLRHLVAEIYQMYSNLKY